MTTEVDWGELVEHPAWQALRKIQEAKRTHLIVRLIVTASTSVDANVAKIAREILTIDSFLNLPLEERDRERERESVESGGPRPHPPIAGPDTD